MSRSESGSAANQGAAAQMRDKASEVASQVRDAAQEKIQNLKDTAGQQYEQLRETATEYYDQGREKAVEWQHQVEDYVREQPLKALAMAAGVGVLLGVLWRRS